MAVAELKVRSLADGCSEEAQPGKEPNPKEHRRLHEQALPRGTPGMASQWFCVKLRPLNRPLPN